MTAERDHLIVTLRRAGRSQRQIADLVGVSRNTVRHVLDRAERARQEGHSALPAPRVRRPSILDGFDGDIAQLLDDHPDITAVRLLEELRGRGFEGSYTIVKERLRRVRPTPKATPADRMVVCAGQQGQQDWSPYMLNFQRTGRQQIQCFSLVLSYSRRSYLQFTEDAGFYTLIRQHVAAFEHFKGVPAEILYDRQKAVVLGREVGRNVYNPRFLAFATHYGFRPRALPPRTPKWKGRVERMFQYIEGNCLNARTFDDLAALQAHATWWSEHVADARTHRRTGETPRERFAEEADHLLHLPAGSYDTAEVGYRVVSGERFVSWDGVEYSVPPAYVLDLVIVRALADEIIVYGHDLKQIAAHERAPRGHRGPVRDPAHFPKKKRDIEVLIHRMTELGECGVAFAAGVCRRKRFRGVHLARTLALQERYSLDDMVSALQRAVRFGAFDAERVTRILELTATPRVLPDTTVEGSLERLRQDLAHADVSPRKLDEYQRAFRGEAPTEE